MSRTRASSSIALAALVLVGGFGLTGPAQAQQAAQPRLPASAEERAAYGRLDPLARSVFWSREMEINPADPVAGVRLAESLRQMGQHEQAAQTAQQVLASQPANVDAMLEVGRAHIARGQAFYGIAALEQARVIAPNDWRPLSLLGVAYQHVRRADDARIAWEAALRLSPENPEVLNNSAMALATAGDAAGAEALLRRAVAGPSATQQMRLNLAMVLGLQGRIGEAEQIIRRELPPEAADRNIEWLRNQSRPQSADVRAEGLSSARTWSSLQSQ
ncbi:MAG: tetratricopeptide repeat protein [Brevundimonas sp.]|uniref:tetratricopeptide repeat protein n=1 Tax=Brevundimonas sp. TaxID=1871086 RepID=UPI00273465C6|nr:tetratricopeptide repeat protein [Brevundimonas sp.]MDP3406045.1 tetratricopeptide repeat protein [Brevundimonas sp.]